MNNANLAALITDRTAADVFNKTDKGYYNLSDIQRINSYIQYLSDALSLNLTVKTFIIGEDLTRAEMESILNNINAIRAAWYVADDTPQTPEAFAWNYEKANDVERILQALDEFYQSVQSEKLYSGNCRADAQIKVCLL